MADLLSFLNVHERKLKELGKRVDNILKLEERISKLSDEELKNKTVEFRLKISSGATLEDILEEAFAVVREASNRTLNMKHYPVQLMGGIALHEGNVAQMQTGEGKTLVATLPAYLNALSKSVFVITANDYLAKRDKEEMSSIYNYLGLKVGLVFREQTTEEKHAAYSCDIVYGSNSEFGFDYLKDNMVTLKHDVVQKERNYVILDEIDNILIDEARTPLIITGESNRASEYYSIVDSFVKGLKTDEYELNEDKNVVHLTQLGMDRAESHFSLENIADIKNTELLHHIRQSLTANFIMKKDKDYVVDEEELFIVDKFTGRVLKGSRFSRGLHQALEAKENLEIKKESKTEAMITYQNYFKLFKKMCGMTGTAATEKQEFKDVYNMEVIVIPTNKPMIRADKEDLVFENKASKFRALVAEVERRNKLGQPILIGTLYIDESEKISELLNKKNIKHKLLNAKQNKDEADIIARAGQRGAVTIATNMAGRGTDIKLGYGVNDLGGLYVIGTEKHEARRIDNQLRGRSGRQGDTGESQFYISLEDSLFENLNKEYMDKVMKVIEKFNFIKDEPLQDSMVSSAIEGIQKNIEIASFNMRKATLEFDEILNKQRDIIYGERNKILNGEDMSDFINVIIDECIEGLVNEYTAQSQYQEEWMLGELQEALNNIFFLNNSVDFTKYSSEEIEDLDRDELREDIKAQVKRVYKDREQENGEKQQRFLERVTLMKNIDDKWNDHLDLIDQIRQGIMFQYIGGENPIRVFNKEAFALFNDMLFDIKENTIKSLFFIAGIDNELEEISKIKESHEISQEEKRKRVEGLEDKYKLSRWFIPKLSADSKLLKFNVDINAMEEVNAKVCIYYMDNGYEEKLKQYEQEVLISGVTAVEFEKLTQEDWELGWYQVKVFVSKKEVKEIDYLITQAQIDHRFKGIMFFSNKSDMIRLDTELPHHKEYLEGIVTVNKERQMPFKMRTVDNKAALTLQKPERDWEVGLYEVTMFLENNTIIVPYFVVVEHSKAQERFMLHMDAKDYQNRELVGVVISVDTNISLGSLPLKLDATGLITLGFKSEIFKRGRYELRLCDDEENILMSEFFLVN